MACVYSRNNSFQIFHQESSIFQVSAFNAKVEAELHVDDESSIKWTDTSAEPPIIVGEPVSFRLSSIE